MTHVEKLKAMRSQMDGAYESADDATRERVRDIACFFHMRTGAQPNGEWGEISITPSQLRNALAYAATNPVIDK